MEAKLGSFKFRVGDFPQHFAYSGDDFGRIQRGIPYVGW